MTMKPVTLLGRIAAIGWLAALAVSTASCDKAAGSCDWRPQGGNRCFDYPSSEVESAKKGCTDGRKWSDTPCNQTGSVGGCKTTNGITKWLYPGDKIKDRASAEKANECTSWIDPSQK